MQNCRLGMVLVILVYGGMVGKNDSLLGDVVNNYILVIMRLKVVMSDVLVIWMGMVMSDILVVWVVMVLSDIWVIWVVMVLSDILVMVLSDIRVRWVVMVMSDILVVWVVMLMRDILVIVLSDIRVKWVVMASSDILVMVLSDIQRILVVMALSDILVISLSDILVIWLKTDKQGEVVVVLLQKQEQEQFVRLVRRRLQAIKVVMMVNVVELEELLRNEKLVEVLNGGQVLDYLVLQVLEGAENLDGLEMDWNVLEYPVDDHLCLRYVEAEGSFLFQT